VDAVHMMTYDYQLSANVDARITAPNQPLHDPKVIGVGNESVSSSIDYAVGHGVAADKLVVGLAMYGHTWFVPAWDHDDWSEYGLGAFVSGKCFGPFKATFGAFPSPGSSQCGLLMYSEISELLKGPTEHLSRRDPKSGSDVAFLPTTQTWVSYQGLSTAEALAQLVKKTGIQGIFAMDPSMDTVDPHAASPFTFDLIKATCVGLYGKVARCSGQPGPAPPPSPSPSPSPPPLLYVCNNGECVAGQDGKGVPKVECEQICAPPTHVYSCSNGRCVAGPKGLPLHQCEQVCVAPPPSPPPSPPPADKLYLCEDGSCKVSTTGTGVPYDRCMQLCSLA